jgi:signal transduction histidine kinase
VEAQRLLAERSTAAADSPATGSRDLFRKHEQVVFIISRLAGMGFQRVAEAETEIDAGATRFNFQSLTLLCASLGLALVCSVFTVRATRSLFRRMAWQEGELTRVSWHMLAHHETIARRFSHELHDELGQTLAALRSNLTSIQPAPGGAGRLADSTRLLDDAIGNVRQLSQLLRPMILDDFGLDAGLGWLCEGFMQRTGIEVDYHSDLHCRLADLTETHLFRIAQEALTNIARHSGATKVKMELHASADEIRLTVVDNGKGIADPGARRPSVGVAGVGTTGMGMTGMRARTRAVGGVFRVSRPEQGGLKLEVAIPFPGEIRKEEHEADPDFVGR